MPTLFNTLKRLLRGRNRVAGRPVGRRFTQDTAITYRMGAGRPGDVNRTHPADCPPFMLDATNPPTFYGQACKINNTAGTLRSVLAADQAGATDIDAVLVSPYPEQTAVATNYGATGYGSGTPPTAQPATGLVSGYIMVQLPAGQTCQKGSPVYVWAAASAGAHVLGGFEAQASAGNTFQITSGKTYFNGSPDANGVVELAFNL